MHLVRVDVVLENLESLRGLSGLGNCHARAPDNLSGLSIGIDLAESRPFAELLAVGNLDDWDLLFAREGLDQFDVSLVVTAVSQDNVLRGAGSSGSNLNLFKG